jgi:hypothetical protein
MVILIMKFKTLLYDGQMARMWKPRNEYRILVRKLGKRSIARPRRTENNIKMATTEVRCKDRK